MRKKFNLKPFSIDEFVIPEITGNLNGFPIPVKTVYMVTQYGCPHSCDFCVTNSFFKYKPLFDSKKIIEFIEKTYFNAQRKHPKDVFLYLVDANAFYPERVWREVFNYFITNARKFERNIFVVALASLHHLSKFNIELIQKQSALKFLAFNYGIESAVNMYDKNKGNALEMVEKISKLGIITIQTSIIGFPFHTKELLKLDIENNLKFKGDTISVNSFKPVPKTLIYERLKNENRIFGEDLPPELWYCEGFMPFHHKYLGSGFDILDHCFLAYNIIEEGLIDTHSTMAGKMLRLFEFTSSRKIKQAAKRFMALSNINFEFFKSRMPMELVNRYAEKKFKIEKLLVQVKR